MCLKRRFWHQPRQLEASACLLSRRVDSEVPNACIREDNTKAAKNHLPLASSDFPGLPHWRAGRIRRGTTVGELVVDAKLSPLHLVTVLARVHGVVDVGEVYKGGYTLRGMLLR